MKTLFRVFAVLCVLVLLVVVGAYFTLTNAGFQKSLVMKQLPEGSSLDSIHVTPSSVEVSGLVLMLPDGTRVEVGAVNTAFEPLAAVFDQTIKLGALEVEGLRVDLPAPSKTTDAATPKSSGGGAATTSTQQPEAAHPAERAAPDEASNPLEALYALEDFEWLFDVERIAIDGVLNDGKGTQYTLKVTSDGIHPGQPSSVVASVRLVAEQALHSGLKEFDSNVTLGFLQKTTGGFESLRLESKTAGQDAQGGNLITVSQKLDLTVNAADGVATVSVVFDADLPKPELLAPELAILGALQVQGTAVASTDGQALTLSSAAVSASSAGAPVLELDLKQSMVLGGAQDVVGELLNVTITGVPFDWINPWLSDGLHIDGAPLSMAFAVTGGADGSLKVRSLAPIAVGPLTVTNSDGLLLEDLSIELQPVVTYGPAGLLAYSFESLSISDKYGSFISGHSTGVIEASAGSDPENPLAGIQSHTQLEIGLQELFQLPALKGQAAIVGGTLSLDLNAEGTAEFPLRVQAAIKGLRARSMPNGAKDFNLLLNLKQTDVAGELGVGIDFRAGSQKRPSTSLQFLGTVDPAKTPLPFTAKLTGPRLSQADLTLLSAVFAAPVEDAVSPKSTMPEPPRADATLIREKAAQVYDGSSAPAAASTESMPPPWAQFSGEASLNIEEILLESDRVIQSVRATVRVSEPHLSLNGISAIIGGGELHGESDVFYTPSNSSSYQLTMDLGFTKIDPAFFNTGRSKAALVQGQFDGVFTAEGAGQSLEGAVEDSVASLRVTGDKGIVTAFEMDSTTELGLGLAGLIGQSVGHNQISALSNTIPYFKKIRFDSFLFELNRNVEKQITIPKFRLKGESLLFDATGSIGGSELSEVLDQPLLLNLELGAKGKLIKYLKELKLLEDETSADGFRRWNQPVEVTGTLSDPNMDGLLDLLKGKSKKAKKSPPTDAQLNAPPAGEDANAAPTPEQELTPEEAKAAKKAAKKKAKEQKRRDEVDMGLDLINGLFGN